MDYSDEKENRPALSADEERLLSTLTDKPQHADVLVSESGLPAQRVMAGRTTSPRLYRVLSVPVKHRKTAKTMRNLCVSKSFTQICKVKNTNPH